MTEYETDTNERIDPRTERALTQYLTVLPETGRAKGADGLYLVVSQSGSKYLVDDLEGRCTCPDHEYRHARCKHLRRVAFATGEQPIPAGVDGVDPQLGEHVNTSAHAVATDGGVIAEQEQAYTRTRVPVSGGVLVFESRAGEVAKELIGFEEVIDWDGVRSALAARGIGVGGIHHLPVLDRDDERGDNTSQRHKPADFGGGEGTGVQEL
jgi:hypothetical protein